MREDFDSCLRELVELHRFLKDGGTIVIYGAGSLGAHFTSFLQENYNAEVLCYLDMDSHKIGSEINGIKVCDPREFQDQEAKIIIASIFTHEICPWLEENGFNDYQIYLAAYFALPAYRETLQYVYSLLEDEISKKLLTKLVSFYLGQENTPPQSPYLQYIHPKLKMPLQPVIVDGGSFDGDTVRLFQDKITSDCHIHAFEPILENYEMLVQNCENQTEIKCYHGGLWETSGTQYFKQGGLYAASIVDDDPELLRNNSDAFIALNVFAIDDVIAQQHIDLIKMDIEGAELAALKGAEKTIAKYSPNLAICIYHKPEDWLLIPQFIEALLPNHEFYIGHHSHNIFETVFYALRR